MLAKKKKQLVWCTFNAMAKHNIPKVKRWRCPECGKRFLVHQKPYDEFMNDGLTYNVISRHKREV